jgi:hypothetical protein
MSIYGFLGRLGGGGDKPRKTPKAAPKSKARPASGSPKSAPSGKRKQGK